MTASSSFIYILYVHSSWLLQLLDLTSLLTACWSLDLKWFEKMKAIWSEVISSGTWPKNRDCSPVTRWRYSFIWNEMIPTIPRVLTDQYLRLLSDIFRKFPDHVGTSRSEFECPVNFPGIPNQLGKASRRRNLYKKNPFESYFLLIWPKIRPSNVITAAKM